MASFHLNGLTLSIVGTIDEMDTPLGERNRDSLGIKTIKNSLANMAANHSRGQIATEIYPKIDVENQRAVAKILQNHLWLGCRKYRFMLGNNRQNNLLYGLYRRFIGDADANNTPQ